MRNSRARLLMTLLCAAAMALNGCYTWRVQSTPVATVISERSPHEIRVVRTDGARKVLTQPRVVGDSIRSREGAMAAASVASVQLLRFDPLKSILTLGTTFLGFVTVALALDPISVSGLGWRIAPR